MQPTHCLWISATNHQADSPRCKDQHCSPSIDTHFRDGAGIVSYSWLLINVAYTSFMNVCIQFALRLLKMPYQISLTHCWFPFSEWGRERISIVFDYKGRLSIRKGQWGTKVTMWRLAVGYLDATVNGIIRKAEPGIQSDGSGQPLKNQ